MSLVLRIFVTYLLAVIVATVLATIAQTQINLNDLQRLDVTISSADRLQSTLRDLFGFTPLMGLLVAVTFMLALPVAEILGRLFKPLRTVLYAMAGATGIWVAFRVTDGLVPPPTLIAATRGLPGSLLLMATVAIGSTLFALLTRPEISTRWR